jgi:hypothetical protein
MWFDKPSPRAAQNHKVSVLVRTSSRIDEALWSRTDSGSSTWWTEQPAVSMRLPSSTVPHTGSYGASATSKSTNRRGPIPSKKGISPTESRCLDRFAQEQRIRRSGLRSHSRQDRGTETRSCDRNESRVHSAGARKAIPRMLALMPHARALRLILTLWRTYEVRTRSALHA